MPKVLVTDHTFDPLDIEQRILEPLGAVLDAHQCKTPEQLVPLVADADAVLTQFSPVNAQVITAMRKVRVIVRYGIGVDNVDLQAARERGIPVCNVPDYCIDEVADHTIALILGISRQVVRNALAIRHGNWGLPVEPAEMKALCDLTVGIVGLGRIGRGVAQRLAPFRCRQLAFDPALSAETIRAAGCEPVALAELLESSDLVTLHCPSTPQTRHLLNRASIGRM